MDRVCDFVNPMEPIKSSKLIEGQEFTHEIKWDGVRIIAVIRNGETVLYNKKGIKKDSFIPELKSLSKNVSADNTVLDGELVVIGESGKPDFNAALVRATKSYNKDLSCKYPISYVVFDLLAYDSQDTRGLPLYKRKTLLDECIRPSEIIIVNTSYDDPKSLFEVVKQRGLEGVVSKKRNSIYKGGKKHNDWYKTKYFKKQLTVVGGVQIHDSGASSLLVGSYINEKLNYLARVSIGFKECDSQTIRAAADKLYSKVSPFKNSPTLKNVLWLKPYLTCWVEYLERTNSGSLRHPKLLGFSKAEPETADGSEYIAE